MTPLGERMARLETSVEHLDEHFSELSGDLKSHRKESIEAIEKLKRDNADALGKMREENAESFKKIREDIAELMELKQRGQGAFWLVMSIVGSGFVGAGFGIWELINRGGHG